MQQVACQFSVYPLGVADLGAGIRDAVEAARRRGLSIEVGPMSSTMAGPSGEVFAALGDAFEAAATVGCVLVATVSNVCTL